MINEGDSSGRGLQKIGIGGRMFLCALLSLAISFLWAQFDSFRMLRLYSVPPYLFGWVFPALTIVLLGLFFLRGKERWLVVPLLALTPVWPLIGLLSSCFHGDCI